MSAQTHGQQHHPSAPAEVPITIDHKPYKVSPTVTGRELKKVGGVKDGYALFRIVRGPGADVEIGDDETITVEPGTAFISAKKTIDPGDKRCCQNVMKST